MPRDDKRPGRALGFGLPEPDTEPDDTSIKDMLRSIETKLDELLSRGDRKRGRPRDAQADMLKEQSEISVLALRAAIEHVQASVPLSVQVVADPIMEQVVQAFEQRHAIALKAAGAWHYQKQRKVKTDPARAMRSAKRRRNRIDPPE